jgi:pimeloyl-ACP methyl ester carboxylesterase
MTDRFLHMDGVRLEYCWIGPKPAEAPTLVFLHEGLGSVALWRDFPAKVAEATGCGALLYSRRGYGSSDAVELPRPFSYLRDEALDVLPKVLAACGVQRAVLIGHSDGASIALLHAGGDTSSMVEGVVAMAPHVMVEPVCLDGIAATTKAYAEGDLRRRLARYHGDNVDGAFRGWSETWLHPGYRDWDMRDCLPRIRVPLLVIQGDGDEYATARQYEIIAREVMCPVEVLVPADCRHSPHRDQPEQVLAAITAFVQRVLQSAGA